MVRILYYYIIYYITNVPIWYVTVNLLWLIQNCNLLIYLCYCSYGDDKISQKKDSPRLKWEQLWGNSNY